jgi:hypothetical protein
VQRHSRRVDAVTGRRRRRAWALPVLLGLVGLGLVADGWRERQFAWLHTTSLNAEAAGEAYRLSRESPVARREYEAGLREGERNAAAARESGTRWLWAGLGLVGAAMVLAFAARRWPIEGGAAP